MARRKQTTFLSKSLVNSEFDAFYGRFSPPKPDFTLDNNFSFTTPEQALWLSCLGDGIRSARRGNFDDLKWVFSQNEKIGSFSWICFTLNIDPAKIRNRLINEWNSLRDKNMLVMQFCGDFLNQKVT